MIFSVPRICYSRKVFSCSVSLSHDNGNTVCSSLSLSLSLSPPRISSFPLITTHRIQISMNLNLPCFLLLVDWLVDTQLEFRMFQDKEQDGYCSNGHLLHKVSAMDLATTPHSPCSQGAGCDGCGTSVVGFVYHCDLCEYDLCVDCIKRATTCSACGGSLVRRTDEDLLSMDKSVREQSCQKCGTTSSYSFMMVCKKCKKQICPRCFRQSVCNNHSKQHSNNDLMFLIALNSLPCILPVLQIFFFHHSTPQQP